MTRMNINNNVKMKLSIWRLCYLFMLVLAHQILDYRNNNNNINNNSNDRYWWSSYKPMQQQRGSTKSAIITIKPSLLLLADAFQYDSIQTTTNHQHLSPFSLNNNDDHNHITFVVSSSRRRRSGSQHNNFMMIKKNNNDNKDKGTDGTSFNDNKNKKKPRFAQQLQKTTSLSQQNRAPFTTKKKDDDISSSLPSSSSSNSINKDRMWKISKSIDDLENVLMKRYGNELSKWTSNDDADDDDDDDYDNDDNNDDDGVSQTSSSSSPSKKVTKPTSSSSTMFRAKPVIDPFLWQEQQQQQQQLIQQQRNNIINDKRTNKKNAAITASSASFIRPNDYGDIKSNNNISYEQRRRDEMMLRRVQTSQQKLSQQQQQNQQQQQQQSTSTSINNNSNNKSPNNFKKNDIGGGNIIKEMTKNMDKNTNVVEANNNDDDTSSSSLLNFRHLITAKAPVGGRGTNQIPKTPISPLSPLSPLSQQQPSMTTKTGVPNSSSSSSSLGKITAGDSTTLSPTTTSKIATTTTTTTKTFFFSAPTDDDDNNWPLDVDNVVPPSPDSENIKKQQRIQKVKREPLPLYNDDDQKTPMYLTLDQAKRNYQKIIIKQELQQEEVEEQQQQEDGASNAIMTATIPKITTKDKTWEDIGITDSTILRNLRTKMSCKQPLYVQQQTCPLLIEKNSNDNMNNNDIVIGTYTGSGKTLAFVVPIIQRLINEQASSEMSSSAAFLKVLIVAPGRELASQIVSVIRDVIQDNNWKDSINVALAIGGTTYIKNYESIRKKKPNIIVGTPGRIGELILGRADDYEKNNKKIKISNVQTIILDEFDALLQYNVHREPTLAILQTIQKYKNIQSIYCSATSSDMIIKSNEFQNYIKPNYKIIMANDMTGQQQQETSMTSSSSSSSMMTSSIRVSPTIIHGVIHIDHKRYVLDTIRKILYTEPTPQQILIFVENSHKVDRLVEQLYNEYNIIAAPLHGDNNKLDRTDVNIALRKGTVGIVVATEIAARGLDAPLLTHVINIDIPTDIIHYTHRAGRCGRGYNQYGVVITLTTSPVERNVPYKFLLNNNNNTNTNTNTIMNTVTIKNGKLNIIDPSTQDLD